MVNPFKYHYKSTISINAKKELVWKTLTDLEQYKLWNPFTTHVETDWKIGQPVILQVQMRKGKKPIRQIEYLSRFNPIDELAWGMKWSIFLKAERVQRLTANKDESTEYFTEDVIEGFLSPIVHLIYGKSIQRGFDSLATSLKLYLENL